MSRHVYYVAHPLRPTPEQLASSRAAMFPCASAVAAAALLRANLDNAMRWLTWLRRSFPAVTFVAPWIASVLAGDDDADPAQREAGLLDADALIPLLAGVVLVGGRISSGMLRESEHARWISDLTWLGHQPPTDLYNRTREGARLRDSWAPGCWL